MSNDSPFVAPGTDGSAPLQAPPVAQAQIPAFGAAVPGAAPQAPMAAPGAGFGYAGIPAAAPRPVKPNRVLAITMVVLSAAYVVLCLVEIFALAHRVSLANQLINDPTSVTMDQADSADGLVSGVSIVAMIVFIAALIVMSVWQRSLRTVFAATGQYQAMLKESGYQIFRIVWLVSFAMAIFLRGNGTLDTPQDAIHHDHSFMLYFGIRAALGLLLIYLAVRLTRIVQRGLTLAQSGYSQDAVNYLSS